MPKLLKELTTLLELDLDNKRNARRLNLITEVYLPALCPPMIQNYSNVAITAGKDSGI